jgi:hypothetical protein
MRRLLSCLGFGTIFTILASAMLLETGWVVPGWLLLPGMWLADATFGSRISTSESGANNFVALVLVSSVFNLFLYTALSYCVLEAVASLTKKMNASP